jgi:hypothetical protein
MPGRFGISHDVTVGRLDLDHIGAEIAQDLRRQRPSTTVVRSRILIPVSGPGLLPAAAAEIRFCASSSDMLTAGPSDGAE